MTEKRFAKAEFAAWVGIIGNVCLAAIKGVIGFISGSMALIADAAHSFSDVVGSFAVLLGLKVAKSPPDEDHPYGHGKAETIAAMIVSMLLIVIGVQIGISAVRSISNGVDQAPGTIAIIAVIISIIAKELMFQYKIRLGKKLSSQALIANAWEHRSDVYSSIAALLGIGGAIIGRQIDAPILYYLDPIAGIIVAILVVIMGYRLMMEAIHNTMDHVLHDEDAQELLKTAQQVRGVITVDGLRAREHGHYVIVDIIISVHPQISVVEGHEIGKMVKLRLLKKHEHVNDVLVHVNPYDLSQLYHDEDDPDKGTLYRIIH